MSANPSIDITTLLESIDINTIKIDDFTSVICSRTSLELHSIQEEYANQTQDYSRGAHNQPTALIGWIKKAIIKCKTISEKDIVISIVSCILSDPYQRHKPSSRDTDKKVDSDKAEADAELLKEEDGFEEFYKNILFPGYVMNFCQIRALSEEFGDDPELVDEARKYLAGAVKRIVVAILEFAIGDD